MKKIIFAALTAVTISTTAHSFEYHQSGNECWTGGGDQHISIHSCELLEAIQTNAASAQSNRNFLIQQSGEIRGVRNQIANTAETNEADEGQQILIDMSQAIAGNSALSAAFAGGDGIGIGVGAHEYGASAAIGVTKSFGRHAFTLGGTSNKQAAAGYKFKF